jgi:hypothetical protein
MKLPRATLLEIVERPAWGDPGERLYDFDCAPGTGTEAEPNGITDTPLDGTSLPVTFSGVLCPATVADDILVDEDVVDLGTLSEGDAVRATVTGDGTNVYPFTSLVRVAGSTVEFMALGPSRMSTDETSREWVIDTEGHYYVAAVDGRIYSGLYYGEGGTVPERDACCEGGPEYTYEMTVETFTPEPTDGALGGSADGAFAGGELHVYTYEVTSGTSYRFELDADNVAYLDPYLIVYDPDGHAVLGFNDDEAYPDNRDSLVTWRATSSGTVWVVATYWGAWFRGTPGYTLSAR